MYVEVTAEFRAAVESVEGRQEELGLRLPPRDKARILAKSHSAPARQAARIVQHVAGLARVLGEQQEDYVAGHGRMEEAERDQVDAGADTISRQCRALIATYREETVRAGGGVSVREHHRAVAEGLDRYLKSVVSVHSEMRAVRVARQLRRKRLSRLEVNSAESRAQEVGPGQGSAGGGLSARELQERAQAAAAARAASYSGYSTEEEEPSAEEEQAMQLENDRLVEQLSSLTNQVDQVQSKVVKVAELQAVFTEKVLEQVDIIDHVHAEAVAANENVKEGNEAVRQAIQNKASYRVYILFILLVFSFSLLFLDWYND